MGDSDHQDVDGDRSKVPFRLVADDHMRGRRRHESKQKLAESGVLKREVGKKPLEVPICRAGLHLRGFPTWARSARLVARGTRSAWVNRAVSFRRARRHPSRSERTQVSRDTCGSMTGLAVARIAFGETIRTAARQSRFLSCSVIDISCMLGSV